MQPVPVKMPEQYWFVERIAWIGLCLFAMLQLIRSPCLAMIVLWLILSWFASGRFTSKAYGSARFAKLHDLQSAGLIGSYGIILGRVRRERAKLWRAVIGLFSSPWRQSRWVCRYLRAALLWFSIPDLPLIRLPKSVHGMIVGPPGSGKSVGFSIPTMLTHIGSIVAHDPKGELFKATATVRHKRFRNKNIRLDPLMVCGEGGAQLNPLDFIHPNDETVAEKCNAISEALVVTKGTESDPHWDSCATDAISGAILYCVTYAAPEDRTLSSVLDLLTSQEAFKGMCQMMIDEQGLLTATHGHLPAYNLLKRYGNRMSCWQDRELNSIMSSIGRHLSWLNSPLIEKHLSSSTFDPRNLCRELVTVYLILPPKYLGTLSRLLRLWLTTIFGSITENGPQEKNEVLFLLDEAASLGPLPSLYQALILGRGYGIRVWLILQALGQLKTLFPRDGEHQAADSAIDDRVFIGPRDYATAEAISNYLGTATVEVMSGTVSRGYADTGISPLSPFTDDKFSRQFNSSKSKTWQESSRKLLFPDEVLQLPADAVLILTKGCRPVLARIVKYFEAPEFSHLMPDVATAS